MSEKLAKHLGERTKEKTKANGDSEEGQGQGHERRKKIRRLQKNNRRLAQKSARWEEPEAW